MRHRPFHHQKAFEAQMCHAGCWPPPLYDEVRGCMGVNAAVLRLTNNPQDREDFEELGLCVDLDAFRVRGGRRRCTAVEWQSFI